MIDKQELKNEQNKIDKKTVIPETYGQGMLISPPVNLVQIARGFDRDG